MINNFYIYWHFDSNNIVFYVGLGEDLGNKKRFKRAYITSNRSEAWKQTVASNGGTFGVSILFHGLSKPIAILRERALIARLGRLCTGTGPLVNIASGGQHPGETPYKLGQYNLFGRLLKTWDSVEQAVSILSIPKSNIYNCTSGIINKSGDFMWGLYEGQPPENIQPFTHSSQRSVYCYDKSGNLLQGYSSIEFAAECTGADRTAISHCLRNSRKSAGGYKWSTQSS